MYMNLSIFCNPIYSKTETGRIKKSVLNISGSVLAKTLSFCCSPFTTHAQSGQCLSCIARLQWRKKKLNRSVLSKC